MNKPFLFTLLLALPYYAVTAQSYKTVVLGKDLKQVSKYDSIIDRGLSRFVLPEDGTVFVGNFMTIGKGERTYYHTEQDGKLNFYTVDSISKVHKAVGNYVPNKFYEFREYRIDGTLKMIKEYDTLASRFETYDSSGRPVVKNTYYHAGYNTEERYYPKGQVKFRALSLSHVVRAGVGMPKGPYKKMSFTDQSQTAYYENGQVQYQSACRLGEGEKHLLEVAQYNESGAYQGKTIHTLETRNSDEYDSKDKLIRSYPLEPTAQTELLMLPRPR